MSTTDRSSDQIDPDALSIGTSEDGKSIQLPTEAVLTGRAFLTGKSDSGKNNSASVVSEEEIRSADQSALEEWSG